MSASELATRIVNLESRQRMERPLRADLAENLERVYRALVRRSRASGSAAFDTTWAQLAAAAGHRGDYPLSSMQKWMGLLAEAGLVEFGGVKDADGAWQRLDVVLLAPPPLTSVLPAGVAQSVQASPICGRRRRRPDWQRHYCPGAGRRGPHRRLSFKTNRGSPEGLSLLFEQEHPGRDTARALRAGSDAIRRSAPAGDRAALEAVTARVREAGERCRAVLETAARDGASPVVVALASWAAATGGQPPKLTLRMRRQLERSAAQFDRLHGPGAAGLWLVHRIGLMAVDDFEDGRVQSLAFYVLQLKQLARQSRRHRRRAPKPKGWKCRQPKGAHAAW